MRPLRCSRRVGVPGKVDVDQGAEPLQVEALRGGISSKQQLDLTTADTVLQQGAVAALETAAQPEPRTVAAGIEADRQIARD